ncbi:transcriptional regulator, HxlR family (plasmid) [Rhizobium leguminosarum bv. trifolii WSM1325]|uniref:Transcriptional regulator, HxlR family n=1 Tax=Rhizobium leguminosarum bv. trifolii (strain WSM1325) TaxID=395491 RepID=C6B5Y6_RHILS|nr:helix-turn-helix domain-containing protein [Rhizobium leguminosarum]ACS59494.1 transcriptional regulator, HxlR family [Rhizobium leguminosarum bv. trifolii WSM1325]
MRTEHDWNCQNPERRKVWAAATSEALRVLEGKWKTVIICQLFAAHGPLRFSELERRVDGVNQKMLIQQLKELEKDGIIVRTVYPEVPPRVEYNLSKLGVALGPAMEALIDWALLRRAGMNGD